MITSRRAVVERSVSNQVQPRRYVDAAVQTGSTQSVQLTNMQWLVIGVGTLLISAIVGQ